LKFLKIFPLLQQIWPFNFSQQILMSLFKNLKKKNV
jgi:hypothetical protein